MAYFLTSDNVKLFYKVSGEGKPVVLIHGWSCNHQHYKYQIEELTKKYKVLEMDLRGHGDSEIPDYGLTIARTAKDVKELIEYLKLENPSLVGWSMGVSVIFDFIKQFGCDDIQKVCLIDMSPKPLTDEEWHLGVYGQLSEKENQDLLVDLNANWDNVAKSFATALFGKKGKQDQALLDWASEQVLKNSPLAMIASWIDAVTRDYRDILNSIPVHTLITYGEDSAIYPKGCSEYMRENIPNSKLISFADCGHALHLEDPEKFNEELINFIG